jgi:hypothetical protein
MRETPYESWRGLLVDLPKLTEDELRVAINIEVVGPCRKNFIERLHMRYTKVRATRERALLSNRELILL